MNAFTVKSLLALSCLGVCSQLAADSNVLITYFSKSGNTKQLAEAIGQGAGAVTGTTVRVKPMAETTNDDLQWANAVAIGCPVYMSNIPHEAMALMSKWSGKALLNKVGSVFVTAGYMSTGEEVTQINLIANMLMKKMIIVGSPDISNPYGVTAITGEAPFTSKDGKIDERFVTRGKSLGKRMAEIAGMIKK